MSDKKRILYVEDDETNRILVRKILRASGYEVLEAEDGLKGVDVAIAELPDLILMDMNMPGLDGYEASTKIKSISELKNTPIIAVTANVTEGDRQRSLISGCDGYISKPIDIDTFVSDLETYMDGKREVVEGAEENKYLKEYGQKLVDRLEDKIRDLSDINLSLENHVDEKVKELQSTQDMLLQSEKMASIGQLAAGVAHEINNPVGFISSNLSTLKHNVLTLLDIIGKYESVESELQENTLNEILNFKKKNDIEYIKDDISDLIEESLDGVVRVKKIVQDLKDFSHVDESEWQTADIHLGLDSTLNMANNEIKYKAEVVKQYGDLPHVQCIPSQLNQVFMNLFVNAAHAIEDRGTITVETHSVDDNLVEIKVSDTGSGIDEKHLKNIFDPFFTTKPVGKGTGLGLALSYGIIRKHGGELRVSSEINVGTTFIIRLPVVQDNDELSL